jgi:C-terminal processing protease CtpA/Prc
MAAGKVACLTAAALTVLADGAAAQDASIPSGMGVSGLWIGMAWTVRDAAEPDREARRSPSVSRIRPCSPAHFAGLQPGDALLSVNGRDTRHGAPFPPGSVGTEYEVRVERPGTGALTLRLQLARRPTKVMEPVSEAPIGSPADWNCPPLDLG